MDKFLVVLGVMMLLHVAGVAAIWCADAD